MGGGGKRGTRKEKELILKLLFLFQILFSSFVAIFLVKQLLGEEKKFQDPFSAIFKKKKFEMTIRLDRVFFSYLAKTKNKMKKTYVNQQNLSRKCGRL